MTREYYARDVTRFSKDVRGGLRSIDESTKGLSLLGGWAVHALVDPTYAMESRDIDVVVHNAAAWAAIEPWLKTKGYGWRTFGKNQFDNAFVHEYHPEARVDFFFGRRIPDDIPQKLFNTRWMSTIKDVPYEGFVPSLRTVLFDKLETLPKRTDPAKALKDALDASNLLFHNRGSVSPRALLTAAALPAARTALPVIKKLLGPHTEPWQFPLQDLVDSLERLAR